MDGLCRRLHSRLIGYSAGTGQSPVLTDVVPVATVDVAVEVAVEVEGALKAFGGGLAALFSSCN